MYEALPASIVAPVEALGQALAAVAVRERVGHWRPSKRRPWARSAPRCPATPEATTILQRERQHFRTHAARMAYPTFRARGVAPRLGRG